MVGEILLRIMLLKMLCGICATGTASANGAGDIPKAAARMKNEIEGAQVVDQVKDGTYDEANIEKRLRGALWGMFSADALAMPTHWYYGGASQIRRDYGKAGIEGYTKPKWELQGSILNKSDLNGGGRSKGSVKNTKKISIIGDVINHGKRDNWDPRKNIHYHATLQAGENTLEMQLARVLMKSIVATEGVFNEDHFREAYIEFMTTPGSHNDTYASTCHRMFFANLVLNKKQPKDCPDNDSHNVDAIDGLVLPTITALAVAAAFNSNENKAGTFAAKTAAVTRKSSELETVSTSWGELVFSSVREAFDDDDNFHSINKKIDRAAKKIGLNQMPSASRPDALTACYLSSAVPPTLDMIKKYVPAQNAWTGVLANANVGGENVHRGAILGAILGARAGVHRIPPVMINGLYDTEQLAEEIDVFVNAVMSCRL